MTTHDDLRAKALAARDDTTGRGEVSGFHCICEWPGGCGGLGTLICEGCGGDLCVCRCGGEMECFGCPECNDGINDDWDDDEPRDARAAIDRARTQGGDDASRD